MPLLTATSSIIITTISPLLILLSISFRFSSILPQFSYHQYLRLFSGSDQYQYWLSHWYHLIIISITPLFPRVIDYHAGYHFLIRFFAITGYCHFLLLVINTPLSVTPSLAFIDWFSHAIISIVLLPTPHDYAVTSLSISVSHIDAINSFVIWPFAITITIISPFAWSIFSFIIIIYIYAWFLLPEYFDITMVITE